LFSEDISDKSVSSVLNTSEISIRNVDLIGFLLPGLCHMTAEDASRKILLDNDVQSCLSAYFSHCVDTIVQGDMEEAISDVIGRRFEKVKNGHIFENWMPI
jgi:hypothetical protein